jgi:uncharacterized membrane protein
MSSARDQEQESRSPLLAPFRIIRAHVRLIVSRLIGALVGVMLPAAIDHPSIAWLPFEFTATTRGLVGWNVAVVLYLLAAAQMILRSTHDSIRRRAVLSDEGRAAVLALTAIATFVAMGAIIAELGQSKTMVGDEKNPHIALAVVTVFSSWAFMHLIFAFHYAHEYYTEEEAAPHMAHVEMRGGLRFPNTPVPQYIDFLYFSYVIGVAFQTADVEVCSRTMRAVVLVHGVVAFFFNTTIVALMVNISSQYV